MLTGAVVSAYCFYDEFYKIFGFVSGTIVVFMIIITPSLVHYKLVSSTPYSRVTNILLSIKGFVVALALGSLTIYNWNGRLAD